MIIEGYSVSEAFYMTVITLSTVGFQEVKPLSEYGKWFTSFLIIGSFGTFAYGFTLLAQSFLSGELSVYLKRKRLDKIISGLNGHVIVCGFGRNGRSTYRKLKAYGKEVVVIETNNDIITEYLENKDILYLSGDATKDEVLLEAGIDKADSLVSTLGEDSDNVFVVITARSLNQNIRLVSRSASDSTEKKLKAVGVNSIVMPETVGGDHMATLVVSPNIMEFLEHISVEGSSTTNLEEIEFRDLGLNKPTCNLNELEIRQKTGCTVIGLKSPNGEYIVNPSSDHVFTEESKLFVLGSSEQIENLSTYLKSIK